MYAGAIFIQQSLHLDLYLATVGLLAITALYTVTGTTEDGVLLGVGVGPPHVFLDPSLRYPDPVLAPSCSPGGERCPVGGQVNGAPPRRQAPCTPGPVC